MRGLYVTKEQHAPDFAWFIEGGGGARRWNVTVASVHEVTFFRRSDARLYIRERKAIVRSAAVG